MVPRVVVPRDAWAIIDDELTRVAPQEGVVLPLVSLVRNAQAPHPCITTRLQHLDGVVLSHAVAVPSSLQRNSAVHVSALPRADAWVDAQVEAAVKAFPSLRSAAYLHSHPFAVGNTSPSGTDIQGHMKPTLRRKMEEGLHVSFSFIACRSRAPGQRWLLRAFACTPEESVVDVGDAAIVDVNHPWVRVARLPHGRHRGMRGTIRRWRRLAFEAGISVVMDDLMDGWVRLRMRVSSQQMMVVLLGHATASVEHVLWINGSATPVAWDPREDVAGLVQRAAGLARNAA